MSNAWFYTGLLLVLRISTGAQTPVPVDELCAKVPHASNMQGLAVEPCDTSEGLVFYIGFKEGDMGSVQTYYWKRESDSLEHIRSFVLPPDFRHPNDMQVTGDSLMIIGWNKRPYSIIGWFDKHTGALLRVISDTLKEDKWLQFGYVHENVIYRGLTNLKEVSIQKYAFEIGFKTIVNNLHPGEWSSYEDKIIQGVRAFDKYLAVIIAFPTRIDLYDISRGFQYKCSLYGEFDYSKNSPESQGLGVYQQNDSTYFYFGLRWPNRINVIKISKEFLQEGCLTPHEKGTNEIIIGNLITPHYPGGPPVEYYLTEEVELTISLYNLLGMEVVRLYKGIQSRGRYQLSLDDLQWLASGMYVLKFSGDDFSQSVRLFLMN